MSRFFEEVFGEDKEGAPIGESFVDESVKSNILHLQTRSVYGRNLYYPKCDRSGQLIKLTGHKSFTEEQVGCLQGAGFGVLVGFSNIEGEVPFTPKVSGIGQK